MNVKTIKKKVKDEFAKVCGGIQSHTTTVDEAPIVDIPSVEFIDSCYSYGGDRWEAVKLYHFAKEKGYRTFDLPVAGINLASSAWDVPKFSDFLQHMKRVQKCTLDKPILLDNDGFICDGWHRLAKAILEGHKYIKAIRLEEMPAPSSTYVEKED